jgi:hypothetical protein
MILAAMMWISMQGPLTLAEIERLPPAAAGERLLAGQAHGPIEAIVRRPPHGMDPPDTVELQLVERAVAQARGCSRRRWSITFSGPAWTAVSSSGPHSVAEVALLRDGSCPGDPYVHVDPGMAPAQALDALAYLDAIRSPRSRVVFTCFDRTSSRLCGSRRTIRRELARLSPWAVSREGDDTLLWLGVRGETVTEVRYRAGSPNRIIVTRRIPAPF